MTSILSDQIIQSLISEPKLVPANFGSKLSPRKVINGSYSSGIDVTGINGSKFHVYIRVAARDSNNFSAGLGHYKNDISRLFLLKRYNGKHYHFNPIENISFTDYHIHTATKRYQQHGKGQEEKYAIVTDRYSDFHGALECLLYDCGFLREQTTLASLEDDL